MSKFGEDLIRSLSEAVTHANGVGAAILQKPLSPKEGRDGADRAGVER